MDKIVKYSDFLETHLEALTYDESNFIIKVASLDELNLDDINELNAVKVNDVYMIEKDDESYLCSIISNRFVVEFGYSEVRNDYVFIITANQNGIRTLVMLLANGDKA